MPLPETFTNATPARDVHAAAHNETNLTVNDLIERFPFGTGSPEGVVTAAVGAVYQRLDGGANSAVYRKESGSGNTGWVAVANGGVGGDATTLTGLTPAELRDRATHTGTHSADDLTDGTTNHVFTVADDTKLAGVATGATVNSADATLLARANHTGTQTADTVTDGTTNKAFTATEKTKLSTVEARANHTGTQSADTLTDGSTNKAFLATERTKLSGVATGATANSADATLLARANHTGTQSADTVVDGSTNHVFTTGDDTKLTGIATGATANDTDANLKARANHTGTQSADTLTDGTTNKAFLATERTKLTGIATSATANDTDANLKARANHTGTQLAATISDFTAAVGLAIPVAPSTEVAYAQITADQAFTVDNLNIDLVSGLAVTIPNIAVPVYVHALIAGKHSVTSAVINANLCKTSPTPATILDAIAMGFACCTVIGNQANCAVVARIPPSTPCTVQLYVSGNSGTMTVLAQTYAPSKIWAVTA